jgi:hypothetical protein
VKVGDLVEIYRHIPRHESGAIPVGKLGVGVIVDVQKNERRFSETQPDTVVAYMTADGAIETEWTNGPCSGAVVTMKVINESR